MCPIVWRCSLLLIACLLQLPATAATLAFTGKVVDARGQPVGGAAVTVSLQDDDTFRAWPETKPKVTRAVAAADGSFRLEAPVRGIDWIAVVAAMKGGHGPGGRFLGPGDGRTDLRLRLTRATSVAGRVLDDLGEPLPGATVTLDAAYQPYFDDIHLPPPPFRPSAVSDGRGRFRIPDTPVGCYLSLVVEHPRYARWVNMHERIQSGEQEVMAALRPAGAITGRVVAENGAAIANARVHAYDHFRRVVPGASTDTDGRFRIGPVLGEYFCLYVVPPGEAPEYVAAPQVVTVTDGAEARCPDFRMLRGGLVTGRVTDVQGKPLAGAWVAASCVIRSPHLTVEGVPGPRARSGADGLYRLRLPPGEWTIGSFMDSARYILASGAERGGDTKVTVAAGKEVRRDFRYRSTLQVFGKVLDAAGHPAAEARVEAALPAGYRTTHWTDAAGRHTVVLARPGDRVRLTVVSRDGRQGVHSEAVVTRTGLAPPIVRLRPLPAITGRVMGPGGTPVADAIVRADLRVPAGGGMSGFRSEPSRSTLGDAQGRFVLPVFPGAAYRVSVEAAGFLTTDRYPVRVERDAHLKPLRFSLDRADGVIAGRIVDPDGKPVTGARVFTGRTGATNTYIVGAEATSDARGRFRLARLPRAGEFELTTSKPGYHNDWGRRAEVGATSVRILLVPDEADRPRPAPPKVGDPAPEIRASRWLNSEGAPDLAALRGKTVVLQFSTPYNAAAKSSNAQLKALHAALRARGRTDVVLLALYDAASATDADAYIREEALPFSVGIAAPAASDGGADTFQAYGARQLPALFVIDPEGRIRTVNPPHDALLRLAE